MGTSYSSAAPHPSMLLSKGTLAQEHPGTEANMFIITLVLSKKLQAT